MRGSLLLLLAACGAPSWVDPGDPSWREGSPELLPIGAVAPLSVVAGPFLTGEANPVSVSQGPPGGRFALYVSTVDPSLPGGTPLCPAATSPACLDLSQPGFLVRQGVLDAQGAAEVTVTPPLGLQDATVWLQAIAFRQGFGVARSVPQALDLFDTCAGGARFDPAPGTAGVSSQGPFHVSFPTPIAAAQAYLLGAPSVGPLPFEVTFPDAFTARVSPVDDLVGFTQHGLFTRSPCGLLQSSLFVTGPTGAVGGERLVGRAWVFDPASVVLHEPASLQPLTALLAGYADTYVAGVWSWDPTSQTIDLRGGRLDGAGVAQDTCRPTVDVLDVDFSADPSADFAFDVLGAGELVEVSVTADDGGDTLVGRGSGWLIARDLAIELLGVDDENALCDLMPLYGAPPCAPCPVSAPDLCFFIDAEARAHRVQIALEPVLEADALATCPAITPWY